MAAGGHPLVEQSIVPVVSDVADSISNRLILRALFLRPRAAGDGAAAPPAPPPTIDAGAVVHAARPDGIEAEFKGWARVPRRWAEWVAKLRLRHEPLWRQLGILDGVLASTYRVRHREQAALLQLAAFWSEPTGTFVFPWGEATLTLNDAVLLAGLPLLGVPVREPVSDDRRLEKDVGALAAVRAVLHRSKKKKPAYAAWVQLFVDGAPEPEEEEAGGGDGEAREPLDVEHGAFLAMWLSLFVLLGPPFDVVLREVLPLAARLARGQKVALAPAALAAIYGDLAALKRRMPTTSGEEENDEPLVVSAPMHILQLWVWEHFPQLRPEPVGSSSAPAADQDQDMPLPRAARWHNEAGKKLSSEEVRAVFMSPEEFQWMPYGNRAMFGLQQEKGGSWSSATSEVLLSMERCLRPCELVGMDSIQPYRPHRVARQLGFDQDIPGTVPRASSSAGWETAWETYNVESRSSVIIFPKHNPCVTVEYAKWWKAHASAWGSVSGNGNAAEMEEECRVVSAAKRKTEGAVAGDSGKKMKEPAASANAAEMEAEGNDFVGPEKRKIEEVVLAGNSGKKLHLPVATATRGSSANVPSGPSQSSSRHAEMSTSGVPQPAPDAADDVDPQHYISLSEKLNRITKMAKQPPKPNTETKGRCDKSSTKGHEVRLKSHMSGAKKSLIRERDEDTKLDDARNDEVQVLETLTKPPRNIIHIIDDDELDEETNKEAGVFVEATSKEDDIIRISDDEPEQ